MLNVNTTCKYFPSLSSNKDANKYMKNRIIFEYNQYSKKFTEVIILFILSYTLITTRVSPFIGPFIKISA